MQTWIDIRTIAFAVLAVLTFYKTVYKWIGFFVKAKKFDPAPQTKKYGIVIAARNEDLVIGNLVDSLHQQTYPRDNFQVFVVADNCDPDNRTAEIAREHGATVYERHCPEKARKGWALEYLFENIEKDYGITSFDGYLFFDADNVVSRDYLERMNEAFSTGVDGVIGYRNSKNFEQNWISAHYSIHFMRSSKNLHRPRGRLNLGTHIAGTGYLLSSEMLKDGWHYNCLTEDTQATMDFAVQGRRIEYCEAAEFYDEQPYQIKVMLRQRLRWAKGRMACFFGYGAKLLIGLVKIFKTPKVKEQPLKLFNYEKGIFKTLSFWKKVGFICDRIADICSYIVDLFAIPFKFIAKNFTNFDMIFYLLPISFIKRMVWIGFYIAEFCIGCYFGTLLAKGMLPVFTALIGAFFGTLPSYIRNIISGVIVVIREWKHIHCPNKFKLAFYLITWPLHDMIYPFICFASLFMHVTWKPIKHDVVKTLDDME
jgi:cellulose synthase/poly-beta-1,6-N-acetylglucosamine synthase-like glycosyltransferase